MDPKIFAEAVKHGVPDPEPCPTNLSEYKSYTDACKRPTFEKYRPSLSAGGNKTTKVRTQDIQKRMRETLSIALNIRNLG